MKHSNTFITDKTVEHVADLARLGLSESEISTFTAQLKHILEFVNSLGDVDTSEIVPTRQITGLTNVFREDNVSSSLSQKEALQNAPLSHNGYFKVKAVFSQ